MKKRFFFFFLAFAGISALFAQPVNDDCTGALPIACGGSVTGNTSTATVDAPGGLTSCGTSITAPGVWYVINGTGGLMIATTCSALTDYDTKLSVFEGSCATPVCVDGDDDDNTCSFNGLHSAVSWISTSGQAYYILVHGFSGNTGNFELSVTCPAPPANDLPCNATALSQGNTPFDNLAATADVGEVSPGAGTGTSSCNSIDGWCSFETAVQNSLWYTFTAPPAGTCMTLAIDNTLDLQFAVWEVGNCSDYSSFTEVAANDDGGPGLSPQLDLNNDLTVCLMPGNTYYLQVDGFNGAVGSGNIVLTETPAMGCCTLPTIPTMSEWGLIILVILLLAAGTLYLRRRRLAVR
jgi:hypothetical protein